MLCKYERKPIVLQSQDKYKGIGIHLLKKKQQTKQRDKKRYNLIYSASDFITDEKWEAKK